ncbi:MAG: NERD domain-containing protein, partial [Leptospiraceae bacterium]|nr:NERD domain-containing protein [Leptospiraceae bacterium]
MARMIPSPISPDTHPASREEEFYQRFARELPEDWTVYHGLGLITPDIQKREVDFLIVAPQGIVCLELKNTRFKYEQETWYRLARDLNRWFPFKKANYRNPVEQSQSALEELLDFLDNHNSGRPPVPRRSYCSATFLLQNRRKELADALKDPSLDGAARNVRFADELEGDLLSILQDMTGQNALKSVSKTERQKLHDILVMNLNLVEPFSRRKARQEEDLMRMTRQQYGVLRRFERNGRVLLRGVAGSGKTLIALEGARRLARRGKRVLLLCYSSNLANHLASSTADEPNIHASTMNGFCRSIILEKDPEFGKRRDDSDVLRKDWDRDFESQVLPEKALTSLPSDFPAYDTLVLDEGQDLFSIENIFFLDRVLKGGLETGNWLITYDPGQNLRG